MSSIEYYEPGVLISIISEYNDDNIEINLNNLIKSLLESSNFNNIEITEKKKNISKQQTSDINNVYLTINKRKNRFDDIVERLERKYTSLYTETQDNDVPYEDNNDSDSEDDNDIVHDENNNEVSQENQNGDAIKSLKPKKKSKQIEPPDYYDHNDPFIDDSENAEVAETMILMKVTKTKQSGFFVSSGVLDTIEDDEIINEMELENDDYFDNNTSSEITSSKVSNKKPFWNPCQDILDAFDVFDKEMISLGMNSLSKNSKIPPEVNVPLLTLHHIVKEKYHIGDSNYKPNDYSFFKNTYGYYEKIVTSLGGLIPLGRVKNQITQLEYKDQAHDLKEILDNSILTLKNMITSKIVPYVPIPNNDTQADGSTNIPRVTENYKWRCNWEIPMKTLLVDIENYTNKWVKVENCYRSTLTATDMRNMEDEECELIDLKDALNEVYKDICTAYLESTINGDIVNLHKYIKTEKRRLRKSFARIEKSNSTTSINIDHNDNNNDTNNDDEVIIVDNKTKQNTKSNWKPNDKILNEIENFRDRINLLINVDNLKKYSYIPNVINNELLKFHKFIKNNYYLSDSNYGPDDYSYMYSLNGHYETISEVLGGNISINKIKKTIQQLENKELCNNIKLKLSKTIKSLKELIIKHIEKYSNTNPNENFEFFITWDRNMRLLLHQISEMNIDYVIKENFYRKKILVNEKKILTDEETEQLDEKDQLNIILTDILSVHPKSCKNAEISFLKKIISVEKNKLKKINDKVNQSSETPKPIDVNPISNSASNNYAISSSSNSSNIATNEIAGSSTDAPTIAVINKPKVTNPAWKPCDEINNQITIFKDNASSLLTSNDIKLNKNSPIPHILDEVILQLHKFVKDNYHIGDTNFKPKDYSFLTKTSGYYEAIVDILGGLIPIGRLKLFIIQLENKEKANNLKKKVDEQLQLMTQLINEHIKEIKNDPLSNAQNDLSTNQMDITNDVIDITSNISSCSTSDEISKNNSKLSINIESANTIAYKYRCSWDITMRSCLLDLEDFVNCYVNAENHYRKNLINYDRELRTHDENIPLDEKIFFNNCLNILVKSFPDGCKNADLSTLRSQMSTERLRRKKLAMTEKIEPKIESTTNKPLDKQNKNNNVSKEIADYINTTNNKINQPISNKLNLPPADIYKVVYKTSKRPLNSPSNNQSQLKSPHIDSNPSTVSMKSNWKADSIIVDEINKFKLLVESLDILSNENVTIPNTLYDSLYQLYQFTVNNYYKCDDRFKINDKNFLDNTVGFYESIVNIFNNKITLQEIKRLFHYLDIKNQLKLLNKNKVVLIDKLKNDITRHIVPVNITSIEVAEDNVIKYQCNWDRNMRTKLFEIDELMTDWYDISNQYRSLFKYYEKDAIIPDDANISDIKKIKNDVYQEILSACPVDCINNDISTIKQQLKTEIKRKRNRGEYVNRDSITGMLTNVYNCIELSTPKKPKISVIEDSDKVNGSYVPTIGTVFTAAPEFNYDDFNLRN